MNSDSVINQLTTPGLSSRRQMLKRFGLGAAGLTGLNFLVSRAEAQVQTTDTNQDVAVL